MGTWGLTWIRCICLLYVREEGPGTLQHPREHLSSEPTSIRTAYWHTSMRAYPIALMYREHIWSLLAGLFIHQRSQTKNNFNNNLIIFYYYVSRHRRCLHPKFIRNFVLWFASLRIQFLNDHIWLLLNSSTFLVHSSSPFVWNMYIYQQLYKYVRFDRASATRKRKKHNLVFHLFIFHLVCNVHACLRWNESEAQIKLKTKSVYACTMCVYCICVVGRGIGHRSADRIVYAVRVSVWYFMFFFIRIVILLTVFCTQPCNASPRHHRLLLSQSKLRRFHTKWWVRARLHTTGAMLYLHTALCQTSASFINIIRCV